MIDLSRDEARLLLALAEDAAREHPNLGTPIRAARIRAAAKRKLRVFLGLSPEPVSFCRCSGAGCERCRR